ncbi:HhoA/HhoB/HtrA family serine endopeptidase [Lyngbya sp. CCY1209]|jgi:S1-C subfamily serine protease|uniref:HhoA/HhoB/HtrA family serine endopeptidase n=1 Tax=Lyngbya sp. CCY1209 TaxID=2886103 RepID=UPI002D211C33|nr:HhoA/HhoB/HtrA family serine endopeptidase [Lyngbya sp. CCY1209]MEB3885704.1 trypsin-like peptidase domain-containing protein [Lyngbya sp. CCY1209]
MQDSKKESNLFRQWGGYAIAVVLSVGLTLASLRVFPGVFLPPAKATSPQVAEVAAVAPVAEPESVAIAPQRAGNFVAMAVNRVGPAVVRIDTERTVSTNLPDPFFDDPFFRRFFGDDGFPQFPKEYQQRGQGSGFIVDSNGVILTNAHVVRGADRVTVTLRDGRELQGEVKGADEPSDLAVVKVEGTDLPVAKLGNSAEVQVGDWAIAVGNPLGLDNTVTLGIVSTLNRLSSEVGIPDKRLEFIQTDAAINPGNSGGPLLNERGEVIGINTAIRADGQGIGFAIPIDAAKEIKDRLARGERIPHPFIGIRMISLTPEIAEEANSDPNSMLLVPEIEGVLVVQVIPDSPAARAGLRRGDVITKIDGDRVTEADQLQRIVEKSQIGKPLRFEVRRGNGTEAIAIRPGELQDANLRQ